MRLLTVAEASELSPVAVLTAGFSVRHNGELLIYVNPALANSAKTAVLAHEFGHTLQKSIFDALPTAEQNAVLDEFARWVEAFDKDSVTLRELIKSKSAAEIFELLAGNQALGEMSPSARAYHLSFNEWFADQTGRWLLGETKPPKGPVEKFFAAVADALLRLVGKIKETDKEWGGSVFTLLEDDRCGFRLGLFAVSTRSAPREEPDAERSGPEGASQDLPAASGPRSGGRGLALGAQR